MDWNNHIYINLESRKDRNIQAINEISKLGVKPNRFNAVVAKAGIVGCVLSHMRVIKEAKDKGLPYICVFEDDLVIKNAHVLNRKVNKLLNEEWDVLMLGGNNFKPFDQYDDYIKVNKCFTTTAYIIKEHYFDIWLNNMNEGLKILLQTNNRDYSLDMYNHILQRRDKWFLITPIQIYQKEDYSDIEGRNVNYEKLMLNYDK